MKIVIIGAGVAGLGIGWRLLQQGARVTILERAQAGKGASWAAAGMLAVTGEFDALPSAEKTFALHANALWPVFAQELEKISEVLLGYSRSGALLVASDQSAFASLRARVQEGVQILGPLECRTLVPMLKAGIGGGLWAAEEAHVDNRALGQGLVVAFLKAGGKLLTNEAVIRFEQRSDLIDAALTTFGRHEADAFVIAAGAWGGLLNHVPVAPVKGEMIALSPRSEAACNGPVVWGNGIYIVPRKDRLLVGATVEEVGFDTSLTQRARRHLRNRAEELMPSLKDWVLREHWAGLRPKSPDGLPLLGPTHIPNLFLAGGQYRNGILFAPAIAQLMADMVLGRASPIAAFDPRRFCEGGAG